MPPKEEQQGGGGGFSIWGFGSSMLENVTQNATSFVNTIVETDWNKEFQEIQEGLKEETQTLEHEVEKKLGINHTKDESSAARAAPGQASEPTGMITEFGRRLVTGTAEIFQQVRQQVDAEFTNLEQEAAKKPKSTFPKRAGTGKFSRIDFQAYDEEARQAEAEQTLASNSFMADLHSRLVPLVISDDTFWQRYFFRVQLLKSEHEKRGQRLQRAHHLAGSEAGELPLDEPFDNSDTSSPTATAPADPTSNELPPGGPTSPKAAPPAKSDAAPTATEPAAAAAEDVMEEARQGSAVESEPARPVSDSGSSADEAAPHVAAESTTPAAETSSSPVQDAAAAKGSQADLVPTVAEDAEAATDGPFPETAAEHTADAAGSAEAPSAAEECAASGDVSPASGTKKQLLARVEPPMEGEEHACGSSGGGSAARSPQSSGNVVSSEWSIVSGPQATPAAAAAANAPGNGVLKEPVPAVEEGEEGSENIDVQEEDVNFDDLDSLGGDVDDNGEDADEEEIDENWGQWE